MPHIAFRLCLSPLVFKCTQLFFPQTTESSILPNKLRWQRTYLSSVPRIKDLWFGRLCECVVWYGYRWKFFGYIGTVSWGPNAVQRSVAGRQAVLQRQCVPSLARRHASACYATPGLHYRKLGCASGTEKKSSSLKIARKQKVADRANHP